MMSPLSAIKPISVNVGNHETYDDANGIVAISTQYRFAGMPTGGRKDGCMYFSYEAGPTHVISISSFYPGGFGASSPLTIWLKADLATISRAKTPWVFVSLHAPWYNSNTVRVFLRGLGPNFTQCTPSTPILHSPTPINELISQFFRFCPFSQAHQGDGEAMRAALEPILLAAGVNAIFSGRE